MNSKRVGSHCLHVQKNLHQTRIHMWSQRELWGGGEVRGELRHALLHARGPSSISSLLCFPQTQPESPPSSEHH